LAAYALVLSALEAPLPRFLPWAKPGLANAAALVALVRFGLADALAVAALRGILAGLFLGGLMTPTWWMGTLGAVAAVPAMALALRAAPPLGLVSVSATGAVASNLVQLAIAAWMVGDPGPLRSTIPLLMLPAIPSGVLVGWLAHGAICRMERAGEAR
jgi:heptaprenyl diphosphate synthase